MAIGLAGAKARDHAGREDRLALVRHQRHLAFQDVGEFVLLLVPMALG